MDSIRWEIVKLGQGSGKERQGMDGERWKALKLKLLPWAYTKFDWPTFPPASLIIPRIKLIMGQVGIGKERWP